MMEISLSIQQLTKITGLSQSDLEDLLKGEDGEPLQNAPDIITQKVGERIGKVKQTEVDRTRAKILSNFEKYAKQAGIETFEDAEDAVRQLAEKANDKGGDKSITLETLKPSDLVKIPAFVQFRDAKDAELSAVKSEFEKSVKAQKAATVISTAKEKATEMVPTYASGCSACRSSTALRVHSRLG